LPGPIQNVHSSITPIPEDWELCPSERLLCWKFPEAFSLEMGLLFDRKRAALAALLDRYTRCGKEKNDMGLAPREGGETVNELPNRSEVMCGLHVCCKLGGGYLSRGI
jgi:hypothetical protein